MFLVIWSGIGICWSFEVYWDAWVLLPYWAQDPGRTFIQNGFERARHVISKTPETDWYSILHSILYCQIFPEIYYNWYLIYVEFFAPGPWCLCFLGWTLSIWPLIQESNILDMLAWHKRNMWWHCTFLIIIIIIIIIISFIESDWKKWQKSWNLWLNWI